MDSMQFRAKTYWLFDEDFEALQKLSEEERPDFMMKLFKEGRYVEVFDDDVFWREADRLNRSKTISLDQSVINLTASCLSCPRSLRFKNDYALSIANNIYSLLVSWYSMGRPKQDSLTPQKLK